MHFNTLPKDIQHAITRHIKNHTGDKNKILSFETNNPDAYRYLMNYTPHKDLLYEVTNNYEIKAFADIHFHQPDNQKEQLRQDGSRRRRFIISYQHPEVRLSIYESKQMIYVLFVHDTKPQKKVYEVEVFIFDKILLERMN